MKNLMESLESYFVQSLITLALAIALVAVDNTLVENIPVPTLLIEVMEGGLVITSVVAFWQYQHQAILLRAEQPPLPIGWLIYTVLLFLFTCLMVPLQWAVLLFGLALLASLLIRL